MTRTPMTRKLLLLIGLFVSFTAAAQSPYYGGYPRNAYPAPAFSQQQSGPEQILQEGLAKLKDFIARGGNTKNEHALAFIKDQIAHYFDFAYMAKWAAGSGWKYMNAAEKDEMTNAVSKLFLAALARNLTGYGDPDVTIHRARKGRNEVNVPVTVTPRGTRGVRVRLKFRFYKAKSGWKIFDVTANNTSAVMYYRRYFRQQQTTQPSRSYGYR